MSHEVKINIDQLPSLQSDFLFEIWKTLGPTVVKDTYRVICADTVIAFVILGTKYHTDLTDNAYKTYMKLTIVSVTSSDYGTYQCVSKNSLGDTDGSIKLYGTFRRMVKIVKKVLYNLCGGREEGEVHKSFYVFLDIFFFSR